MAWRFELVCSLCAFAPWRELSSLYFLELNHYPKMGEKHKTARSKLKFRARRESLNRCPFVI
jgi:hypothetical protein